MKQFNKAIMAASVAAVVGGGSLPAHALWDSPNPITTRNVIEQGVDSAKELVAADADTTYTLGTGESLTANDLITIDLTGNAAWGEDPPRLKCDTGDLGAGNNSFATPLSGGTEGGTTASWRAINDLCVNTSVLTFESGSTNPSFDVTGVMDGDDVDFLLTLETSTGIPIGTPNHSFANESTGTNDPSFPFSGSDLFSLDNATVSDDNTAQVQSAYTLFPTGSANGSTGIETAELDLDLNNAAPAIPSEDIAANELLYTLEGDLNGFDEITGTSLESAAGEGDGEFGINDDKDEATASNDAILTAGDMAVNTDIDGVIDGETVQAARTINLMVELDGDTNYTGHTVFGPAPAIIIDRNGTFFTTNSTGSANRIKITDTSGQASTSGGQITIDCWDAAGMPVAPDMSVEMPDKVESDATVTIEGSSLAAYCPLGVRFDFTINTEKAAISNVKRTAEGSVLTVFGTNDGGIL